MNTLLNRVGLNPVVAGITLRSLLGRKRALLFGVPGLALLIITIALKAAHPTDSTWPNNILGDVGLSTVLPLTAVIIGTTALGAEVDEGSVLHLLTTPVRRGSIVCTKFVVAAGLTVLFAAVPELVAAIIALPGTSSFAVGLFVAAIVGAVVYNALFVMISVLSKRAIAYGLLYVLVWETLLGDLVPGVRVLSIGKYALAVAYKFDSTDISGTNMVSLGTAIVMSVVVLGGTLYYGARRLRSFRLTGDVA
jgi:ABC-2 type transport system permease protein